MHSFGGVHAARCSTRTLDGVIGEVEVSYEKWHWRLFNVLARAFGLMSIFAGLAFVASAVFYALHPDDAGNVRTLSGSAALEFTVGAAFCLAMGILFLKVRPYRPDISSQETLTSRSWWTGEPRSK